MDSHQQKFLFLFFLLNTILVIHLFGNMFLFIQQTLDHPHYNITPNIIYRYTYVISQMYSINA